VHEVSSSRLRVEFCGEWFDAPVDGVFTIGRTGDLQVDENPFLHRHFLELRCMEGMWVVRNVGDRLGATLVDAANLFHGHLRSGASMPLVFEHSSIRFGAGPTTYEVNLVLDDPPFAGVPDSIVGRDGTRTRGDVVLTPDQRLCIVALAEPALREGRGGVSRLPQNKEAAERLGWTVTRFNRKLDNVCQKLTKSGVAGLHGSEDALASNRRARLVEYSLASRLITVGDLELLSSDYAK
jgi:hypothetical protein